VITEAALAGVPSIFWDPVVTESFRDEVESGLAVFAPLDQLAQRIDAVLRARRDPVD
jgi:hypothetical protein